MKHEERKEIGSLNGVTTNKNERKSKGGKKERWMSNDRATSKGRKEGRTVAIDVETRLDFSFLPNKSLHTHV